MKYLVSYINASWPIFPSPSLIFQNFEIPKETWTHLFPMHPFSTPFFYMVFWCFQGVEKGCIGNKDTVQDTVLSMPYIIFPGFFVAFFIHDKPPLYYKQSIPANIYMFIVNNRNTRKRNKICSKLTIKTSEHLYVQRKQ